MELWLYNVPPLIPNYGRITVTRGYSNKTAAYAQWTVNLLNILLMQSDIRQELTVFNVHAG